MAQSSRNEVPICADADGRSATDEPTSASIGACGRLAGNIYFDGSVVESNGKKFFWAADPIRTASGRS